MPKKNIIKEDLNKDTVATQKVLKKDIDNTSNDKIKSKIFKIYFEPYNNDGLLIQFWYNDDIKGSKKDYDKSYILNLKKKLSDALNLRKIIKDFEITMYLNDNGNTDENLPRRVKLNRVKQMYELLVDMGLTLIHNLYYVNPLKLEESTLTIEECINKSSPIILSLKNQFEDQINAELVLTPDEFKVLKA